MTPDEIQRALRLITSKRFKEIRGPFPIAMVARLTGLHRSSIYDARNGFWLTPRVCTLLAPVLKKIIAGQLRAQRAQQWSVEEMEMEGKPAAQETLAAQRFPISR